jgi:hypothetical protein
MLLHDVAVFFERERVNIWKARRICCFFQALFRMVRDAKLLVPIDKEFHKKIRQEKFFSGNRKSRDNG